MRLDQARGGEIGLFKEGLQALADLAQFCDINDRGRHRRGFFRRQCRSDPGDQRGEQFGNLLLQRFKDLGHFMLLQCQFDHGSHGLDILRADLSGQALQGVGEARRGFPVGVTQCGIEALREMSLVGHVFSQQRDVLADKGKSDSCRHGSLSLMKCSRRDVPSNGGKGRKQKRGWSEKERAG